MLAGSHTRSKGRTWVHSLHHGVLVSKAVTEPKHCSLPPTTSLTFSLFEASVHSKSRNHSCGSSFVFFFSWENAIESASGKSNEMLNRQAGGREMWRNIYKQKWWLWRSLIKRMFAEWLGKWIEVRKYTRD